MDRLEISIIPDFFAFAGFVRFFMADSQIFQQTEKMRKHFVTTIIVLFLILCAFFYALKIYAPAYNFEALIIGNIVMAVLSISTYYIVNKQFNQRPQAFVRGVFSATLLKLMVCIFGLLIFVFIDRQHIHKPSIFMLFGIYAVYSITEAWLLSRLAKQAK
jgi:hypothetical protein